MCVTDVVGLQTFFVPLSSEAVITVSDGGIYKTYLTNHALLYFCSKPKSIKLTATLRVERIIIAAVIHCSSLNCNYCLWQSLII